MKKIKILYLINNLGIGGAEKLLLSVIKHLDKKKYDVHVCSLLRTGNTLARDFLQYAEVSSLNMKNFHDLRGIARLISMMNKSKFSIIHSHLDYSDLYCQISQKFVHTPVTISTQHSLDEWKKGNNFKQKLRIYLTKKYFNHFNIFLAVSDPVREFAIKYQGIPEEKIITLLNGVEIQIPADKKTKNQQFKAQLGIDPKNKIIGCVARLVKEKGHVYLLEAFSRLIADRKDVTLVLVGDGYLNNEIRNYAKQLQIDRFVKMVGSSDQVESFLNLFDVFVLSSVVEGLPMTLLEAMSFSLPVVVTHVGGMPHVVRNMVDGIVVPPKDSLSLYEALKALINNPVRAEEFGKNGGNRVIEKYSINNMISNLDEIYSQQLMKASVIDEKSKN